MSDHASNLTPSMEIGLEQHRLALIRSAEGRWLDALEAARESNLHLFQSGIQQDSRMVGINYYLAADSMYHGKEWHEASILAELSLRGLTSWYDAPTRAEALLLLAKAHAGNRKLREACEILSDLISHGPQDNVFDAVRRESGILLQKLSGTQV